MWAFVKDEYTEELTKKSGVEMVSFLFSPFVSSNFLFFSLCTSENWNIIFMYHG